MNHTHGLVGTLGFLFAASVIVYVVLAHNTDVAKLGTGITADVGTLARAYQGG